MMKKREEEGREYIKPVIHLDSFDTVVSIGKPRKQQATKQTCIKRLLPPFP